MTRLARAIRFGLVGSINTALDFALLFVFTLLCGLHEIPANYLSTGIAMAFSFVANRTFTFGSTGKAPRQVVLFVAVTVAGMWIIQPLLIWATTSLLGGLITTPATLLLVSKLVATIGSLTWNYILYAKLVFKATD